MTTDGTACRFFLQAGLQALCRLWSSCHGKEDGGIEQLNAGLQAGYDKQARSSSSASTAAQFLLLALYRYDNGNRRVLRAVSGDPEGARWSTWDGWQQTEEYEDNGTSNFFVRKVFFRGRGLTDTLGFARQIGDGTSGNPYTWENYALIQGTLGSGMGSLPSCRTAMQGGVSAV